MYSSEFKKYLKKKKIKKILIIFSQISILLVCILLWEYLANKEIINTFIYSSPSRMLNTIINLYVDNNLFFSTDSVIQDIYM